MTPSATSSTDESVQFDTIESLSEPLSSTDSLSPLVSLLAISYQCKPTLAGTNKAAPHGPERLSALMHAMSPACKTHQHEEMHNSFIRFLTPVLSGMAGLSEFEEAVGAFSDGDDFREFWTFQGRNLIRDVLGTGSDRAGDRKGSELPFVDIFVKDPTCRIALGKNERSLMLVPSKTTVDDEIWQTGSPGGRARFKVVRNNETGHEVDVGEALTGD